MEEEISVYRKLLEEAKENGDKPNEGYNLNNIGKTYFKYGQYDNALKYFELSLEMSREINNRGVEGNILNELGRVYRMLGENDKALKYHEQSLEISRETGNKSGEGANLNNIAVVYFMLNQNEEALNYFKKALEIRKEIGHKNVLLSNLHNIGIVYSNLGQYDNALKYYEKSLEISIEIEDKGSEASSLSSIGTVYTNLSQYENALNYYERSLIISRELGDRKVEGGNLNQIGIVYTNLSQYHKALKYHEDALEISREIGDKRNMAYGFRSIGRIYNNLGEYDNSLIHHELAMDTYREIGDRRGEGASINNIGVVYDNLGQYDKALSFHNKTLKITREIGDRSGEATSLINIGKVYDNLGNFDNALIYYNQSHDIYKSLGDRRGEGTSLNNISTIYHRLGQHEKALHYNAESLKIRREIGDRRGEGYSLNSIGLVNIKLKHYEKALNFFKKAFDIRKDIGDRRGEGISLGNIGSAYNRLGDHEKALKYHEQALELRKELNDIRGEGTSLYDIGLVYYTLGRNDEAMKNYIKSIEIFNSIGLIESLWQVQIASARNKIAQDDIKEAISFFEQGIVNLENLRAGITDLEFRGTYMEEKLSIYDEYIELLVKLHKENPDKNYDERILEIFERKKGRIFLEQISNIRSRNYAGIPESVIYKENEMHDRIERLINKRIEEMSNPEKDLNLKLIRELGEQIANISVKQEKLKLQIKTDYPDYYALRYPDPVTLSVLQKDVLKADEMMLIYNITEDISFLLLVGKDHFSMHNLPVNLEDLSLHIQYYLDFQIGLPKMTLRGRVIYHDPDLSEIPNIYELLFPISVQNSIANVKDLFIVPTGPLYQLPFEALLVEDNTYLIERHSISYLSSASLLKILRDTQARRRRYPVHPLLAFANPVYSEPETFFGITELRSESYRSFLGDKFMPLPETEDEVIAIKEILKAPLETNPLQLGRKASKSNVFDLNDKEKLENYRYIIFACHGILPGEVNHILQPALVLSDPDPVTGLDGFLTMADIFSLSLNADLVTLSACNTGIGEAHVGEGIMGLSRAFMYAGTPVVNVTLWSVETMSAKELNIGFFKSLAEGKSLSDSLRDIKTKMIRGDYGDKWTQPFYWAPMILFGDGKMQRDDL